MSEASTWGAFAPPFSAQFITYDAEFIDDGETIQLISIGMVSGDGREMYAVANDFDQDRVLANSWMRKNVWPHLPIVKPQMNVRGYPVNNCRCIKESDGGYDCRHWNGFLDMDHPDVRTRGQIKRMVSDFIYASHPHDKGLDMDRDHVQLWAYYGAYDHVVLAQLFGKMIDLPAHVPMHTNDLKSEVFRLGGKVSMPPQAAGAHNALADARHNLVRAKAIWAVHTEGNV